MDGFGRSLHPASCVRFAGTAPRSSNVRCLQVESISRPAEKTISTPSSVLVRDIMVALTELQAQDMKKRSGVGTR